MMPNWCMDSITFFPGEAGNLGSLEQLQKDFETAMTTIEEGANNWIGRLLVYKGMSLEEVEIECRSFVDYYSSLQEVHDDDCFVIETSSAWGPMTEMYDWMAKTYELEYVLCAEEPGCQVYVNTDTEGNYYQDRYYISFEEEDEEELDDPYCESFEQVIQTLKENTPLPVTETMTLDELNQLHEDLTVYEFLTSF